MLRESGYDEEDVAAVLRWDCLLVRAPPSLPVTAQASGSRLKCDAEEDEEKQLTILLEKFCDRYLR